MFEVIKGRQHYAVKGIVYGVEGIGKSTFGAQFPRPLFLDVENGTHQLDVDRVLPKSYAEVRQYVTSLLSDTGGYQTLVIDSADWLEGMMIKHICAEANINSIEKYGNGFGKGWNRLAEEWSHFLDLLDRLRISQNMNLLFIAHSKIHRFEPADDAGHDRYTLVLAKQSAEVLKKWSDLTLFVKYDTFTIEEDGKTKIKGGNNRVMYSRFHPCWDAKNRYDLPEKMPFSFSEIKKIFTMSPVAEKKIGSDHTPGPVSEPEQSEKKPPEKNSDPSAEEHRYSTQDCVSPEAEKDLEKKSLLKQIDSLLAASGVGYADLTAEVERRGVVPKGTQLRDYNALTLKRIVSGWEKITKNILNARGEA